MAVYLAVYAVPVRRTNIYLSDAEQVALDAKAVAQGTTRSEVIRAILDRELNLVDDAELDAVLLAVASEVGDRARELSHGDPDLSLD